MDKELHIKTMNGVEDLRWGTKTTSQWNGELQKVTYKLFIDIYITEWWKVER
jgi:hypothetical protein